ncbi:hypothetical protein [Pararhodobacter sp.]|uniref:hypothetical protein n=1 Tax=Pararhodobacter sp. TaxID=2127056 RepID=UPI002FDCA225
MSPHRNLSPQDARNREALEVLAGLKGSPDQHALRRGMIKDIEKTVADLRAQTAALTAMIAAASNGAARQGGIGSGRDEQLDEDLRRLRENDRRLHLRVDEKVRESLITAGEAADKIEQARQELDDINFYIDSIADDIENGREVAATLSSIQTIVTAEYGSWGAFVSNIATAVATTDVIAARQFLGVTAGDNTASLELVAYDGEQGSGSAVRIHGDNTIVEGTLSAKSLVISDGSGNLVPNGRFAFNDFRGWPAVPSMWSIAAQTPSAGDSAVRNAPTPFVLQMNAHTSIQTMNTAMVPAQEGDRFHFSLSIAAGGPSPNVDIRVLARWYNAEGASLDVWQGTLVQNLGSTSWSEYTTLSGAAPSGTAYVRLEIRRQGGGAGRGYVTNIDVRKPRTGSTLILPGSVTTTEINVQELAASSAFIDQLSAQNAWIRGNLIVDGAISRSVFLEAVGGPNITTTSSPGIIRGSAVPCEGRFLPFDSTFMPTNPIRIDLTVSLQSVAAPARLVLVPQAREGTTWRSILTLMPLEHIIPNAVGYPGQRHTITLTAYVYAFETPENWNQMRIMAHVTGAAPFGGNAVATDYVMMNVTQFNR